jgi:hypothetical protein
MSLSISSRDGFGSNGSILDAPLVTHWMSIWTSVGKRYPLSLKLKISKKSLIFISLGIPDKRMMEHSTSNLSQMPFRA